jgi:hypothetical protein
MRFSFLMICLISFTYSAVAQTEKFEKAEVSNKSIFKANSEQVWAYISDLGNLQNLVRSTIKTSVTDGQGLGSTVTLTLQNGGKIIEKVVKFDVQRRVICYTMIETPLPIKDYLACFKVKKLRDEQIEVTFSAGFSVQASNRKARINAFNNLQSEFLENLKNHFQN